MADSEICKFFKRGNCRFGSKCRLLHATHDAPAEKDVDHVRPPSRLSPDTRCCPPPLLHSVVVHFSTASIMLLCGCVSVCLCVYVCVCVFILTLSLSTTRSLSPFLSIRLSLLALTGLTPSPSSPPLLRVFSTTYSPLHAHSRIRSRQCQQNRRTRRCWRLLEATEIRQRR